MQFIAHAERKEHFSSMMIQQDTFGQAHSWEMPGGLVSITLGETPDRGCSDRLANDPDHPDHTWLGISQALIRAELTDKIDFDGEEWQFNTNHSVDSPGGREGSKIALRLLDGGFDLWKRTLRWTSLSYNIGLDEIETDSSVTRGRGFRLYRTADRKLFRGHGGVLSVHGHNYVSREAWASAGAALVAGESPPPWIDFLNEAQRRLFVGETISATIAAAISAETAMRKLFEFAPETIRAHVHPRPEMDLAVRRLISNWRMITGLGPERMPGELLQSVHKVFDLRNDIMHSGVKDSEALSDIDQLLPLIKKFVLITDDLVREKTGSPRRIFPHRAIAELSLGA